MSSLFRTLLLLTLLCLAAFAEVKKPIKVGVLSFRSIEETKKQWAPTVEHLNKELAEYKVEIFPLYQKELDHAVDARMVDFVFTNPEHLARLHYKHEIYPIATIMLNVNKRPTNKFGGVIFADSNRSDIKTLEDLRGKKIAIVDKSSFGGFLVQRWELHKKNIDITKESQLVVTNFPQDNVIKAVIDGKADVGFVRTGMLEAMAKSGAIQLSKLKILNSQNDKNAPFLLSTELYPEWGLAVFPGVDDRISKTLVSALMDIKPDAPCALSGGYFGFSPPSDYVDVESLMIRLGELPATKGLELADVVKKYKMIVLVSTVLLVVLVLTTIIVMYKNNKNLKKALKSAKKLAIRENMLDSLSEGVFGIDKKGKCTFINQTALDMLGYSKEEFIGFVPHDLIHKPLAPDEHCNSCETSRDGIKRSWVDWFITKDGSSIAVSIRSTPILNEKSDLKGAVVSFKNMTSLEDVGEVVSSLALVAQNADSGVIITDKYKRIKWINEAFTDITGYSVEECIGKTPAKLLQGARSEPTLIEDMRKKLHTKEVFSLELINYKKSGEPYLANLTIKPILDKLGEVTGYFGVQVDVTEKKATEERLMRAAKEAESANRIKSEFLANMSHEIRTPLNGIMGFVNLLKKSENLSVREHSYVELIDKSSNNLLRILNDILDFSKIEAEKLELDLTPHSPIVEYSQIIELSASLCAEKNVKPVVFFDPQTPAKILADEIRIKQVLTNLLSNAVKFTDGGGNIWLTIKSEIIDEKRCKIYFSIRDSGIGMTSETLERLFTPFSQADGTTTRQFGGTGLGLSISQSLVEKMGSSIVVKSELGHGSEFSFELEVEYDNSEPILVLPENLKLAIVTNDFNEDIALFVDYMQAFGVSISFLSSIPNIREYDLLSIHLDELSFEFLMNVDAMHKTLVISNAQVINDPLTNMLSPPFTPTKIFNMIESVLHIGKESENISNINAKARFHGNVLIVDDNDVNVTLMENILDEFGLEHMGASDGCDAFELFMQNKFDLVLMDIHMPRCDGVMGLKLIREYEEKHGASKVPIAALTADAVKGKKEEFLGAGFDYYLTKPVKTDELLALFASTLEQSQIVENHRQVALAESSVENDYFSSSKCANELGISEIGVIKSYEQFKTSANETVGLLRSAINSGNMEQTRELAHKIKGSAANLRIRVISDAAGAIEDGCFDMSVSEILRELGVIDTALSYI